MVILYTKIKSTKSNKILVTAIPIGKVFLKIGVRETRVVNIDGTLST